jgi:hypothetical protein
MWNAGRAKCFMDDLAARLVALEDHFGGYHTHVPWRRWSPYAPEPRLWWVTGGDRMARHGYAPHYAAALTGLSPDVIVELGILRGVGLAMWCWLFPHARVIGLDIDVSHFLENKAALENRGAFAESNPEIYEFDELAPDAAAQFAEILRGDQVGLFIDDALHYDEAVLQTHKYAWPHIAPGGLYIIEDNATARASLPQPDMAGGCDGLTIMKKP